MQASGANRSLLKGGRNVRSSSKKTTAQMRAGAISAVGWELPASKISGRGSWQATFYDEHKQHSSKQL
jgi:hypothetical protein